MKRRSQNEPSGGGSGQTEPETDWLAWALHLVAGVFVGASVGLLIGFRMVRFGYISEAQILAVAAGVGLVCGGYTSRRGERAWTPRSLFDWAEPYRGGRARASSLAITAVGVVLIAIPLLFGRHSAGAGSEEHSSSKPGAIRLILAILPGFLLYNAWRNGTGFWELGFVDRDQTPLLFWIYVTLNVVALICLLFAG